MVFRYQNVLLFPQSHRDVLKHFKMSQAVEMCADTPPAGGLLMLDARTFSEGICWWMLARMARRAPSFSPKEEHA